MPPAQTAAVRDPGRLAALHATGLLDAPCMEAFDRLTRLAARLVDAPVALVTLVDEDRQFFLSHQGLPEPLASRRGTPLSHSFCQHVVAASAPLVVCDARSHALVRDNRAVADLGVVAYAGVPLRDGDGNDLGAFCVIDGAARAWTADEIAVIEDLAAAAMTEVELRRRLREEERRSRTDALTGLANRRAMREAIEAELARSAREGHRVGLMMIDIDHFKAINDAHGHAAGDAVLREVAGRIRSAVRAYDVVARWGGEEFAVLLPGIPDEGTLRGVGEAVRRAVADGPADGGDGARSARVSVGCALGARGTDGDALVDAADAALYAAKRRGRDRCVTSSEVSARDRRAEIPEAVRVAMALARAASLREGVPELHCEQVATLSEAIARAMGLDEATVLRSRLGGWLHDVGKIALPEGILSKPGPLSPHERSVMETHTLIGEHIVCDVPGIAEAAGAVRHHHERWEGGGYPDGIAGTAIPVEARIVAVADAFSAMTSDRVYRRQIPLDDALAELARERGRQFDPEAVDGLVRALTDRDRRARARLSAEALLDPVE